MINMDEIIRQLSASAGAIRALVESIPAEQADWKPNPDTWSMRQVMEHVSDEERLDFRLRLKEMLAEPPLAWAALQEASPAAVEDLHKALEDFITEREASLAWLRALDSPDWNRTTAAPWRTISAGDVLVSWVEHDYLHLRQMNELLHAWNEHQAKPYSVQYGGGW